MPEAGRQKIMLNEKSIQRFAGGRGRIFFHQSTVLLWIVTDLATALGQVRKAQLTSIFCLRFQPTNSGMLEGILNIKMSMCCLDCVLAM